MKQISIVKTSNDGMTVVINAGEVDGITPGQRFLLYGEEGELIDPATKESLGVLEVVRGTGKALHVQEKMTTIRSDSKADAARTIRKRNPRASALWDLGALSLGREEIEEIMPADSLPFENARVGDRARLI